MLHRLEWLLKNTKVTHNMFAYRIKEEGGVINEGNNDDGEHGAGITLEGLLEVTMLEMFLLWCPDGMMKLNLDTIDLSI